MQEKLVFPGAWTQGKAEAKVVAPQGAQLVTLVAGGHETVAIYGPAIGPDGRAVSRPELYPTILFFYGNGMYLAACGEQFDAFRRLGANVMIPEYVGYGLAKGSPSEANCYATADAALAWLAHRPGMESQRVVAGGWSLGAAVACDLASRKPAETAGLFMFSAFTSMDAVAKRHYRLLPVGMLLRHHFRSIEKMPRVKGPVLIAHGSEDDLIPYDMSDELAQAATGAQVARLKVEGAGHNDFFLVGEAEIRRVLGSFLQRIESPRP